MGMTYQSIGYLEALVLYKDSTSWFNIVVFEEEVVPLQRHTIVPYLLFLRVHII